MKRIAIFRDGNMMAAMIGRDLVIGVGGFGETVVDALCDLAKQVEEQGYWRHEAVVMVEVAGRQITADAPVAAEAIRRLWRIIAEEGYGERDFAASK